MDLCEGKIIESEAIGDNIYRLIVQQPVLALAEPGQFVMVACGPVGTLRRPFTIGKASSDPSRFEMWILAEGPGAKWVVSQQPGSMLDMIGPLGQGFQLPQEGRLLALLEDRHISPIHRLLDRLDSRSIPNMHLLIVGERARKAHEHVQKDFENAGVRTTVLYGSQSELEEIVLRYIQDHQIEYVAAACGAAWLKAFSPLDRDGSTVIEMSLETQMVCGIGACLGCTIPLHEAQHGGNMAGGFDYKPLCTEGPVIRARRVVI